MLANIMRIPIPQCFLIVAIVTTLFCHTGYAGAVSASGKAVREIAEELAQQIAKPASREFAETTSVQLEKIASKCGNESLDVIEKHGIAALRVFQNAGEEAGPYLVKGIRLYGDDGLRIAQTAAGRSVLREGNEFAIRAVIKHTDAVIPVIRTYGDECAHALTQLSPGNGRRLVQMVDEKTLASADIQKLMGPLGKYGDDAMDFIWRHRKLLATATLLAAFVSKPEPYLKGLKDLSGDPLGKIWGSVNWNLWVGAVLMFAGLWFLFKRRAILFNQKNNKE
jgi:hypothetical protein